MGGGTPIGKRRAGRVTPEGISVPYLAPNEETPLNELLANAFDLVSIGTFRLKQDINIVNILIANTRVFADIAKPLRRNDSILEYLPTQYITEFIKSRNYYGVKFTSTMETGGYNLAMFDENLFEFKEVYDVEIKKIKYSYHKIAP